MNEIGYLGLGSNVGDRRANLQASVESLWAHDVAVLLSSSVYETEPVGEVLDQRPFFNACLRIETPLGPERLLDACKAVERAFSPSRDAGRAPQFDDQAWLAQTRAAIIATRGRLTAELRELGFDVVDSQANFVWATRRDRPVEPLYQQLKAGGVLVRYMNYAGWGDGLRISIGSDEQIDACLALLNSMV